MTDDMPICDKEVWDKRWPRTHPCGNKAIRYRQLTDGSVIFRCGLHSKDKSVEWEEIKK